MHGMDGWMSSRSCCFPAGLAQRFPGIYPPLVQAQAWLPVHVLISAWNTSVSCSRGPDRAVFADEGLRQGIRSRGCFPCCARSVSRQRLDCAASFRNSRGKSTGLLDVMVAWTGLWFRLSVRNAASSTGKLR